MEGSNIPSHGVTSPLTQPSFPPRNALSGSPHVTQTTPESPGHPSGNHPDSYGSTGGGEAGTVTVTALAVASAAAEAGADISSDLSSASSNAPTSSSSAQDLHEGSAAQAAGAAGSSLEMQGVTASYGGPGAGSISQEAADAVAAQMQQVSLAGGWMTGGSGPLQAYSQPPQGGAGPVSQHAPVLTCKDPSGCWMFLFELVDLGRNALPSSSASRPPYSLIPPLLLPLPPTRTPPIPRTPCTIVP